jgi:hypothetical protein
MSDITYGTTRRAIGGTGWRPVMTFQYAHDRYASCASGHCIRTARIAMRPQRCHSSAASGRDIHLISGIAGSTQPRPAIT